MKIGLDISQIVYQTGVSRYTAELVKQLLKIDEANQYFLYGGSLRQRSILRSFVLSLDKQPDYRLGLMSPKLADLFWNRLNLFPPDKGQFLDLFHASNWALPKTRCPLVTTIHDLTFIKFPKEHLPYYIKVHTRHLKRAKKLADLIITDSQASKKDLIDYGIDPQKIRVVYLAASDIFKPRLDKKILEKYQLTKPYLLTVGTQEPRKNLKNLIAAYQKLENPPALVIAGKVGWGQPTKIVKRVNLVGFVPDEDLVTLYSGAKAFIYPSLYEGFGLPILEALSCACPVIVSKVSSLPELAGSAALYFNPLKHENIATAISQLLNLSSSQHHHLKQQSLIQAKRFSFKTTAKETLTVYKELKK